MAHYLLVSVEDEEEMGLQGRMISYSAQSANPRAIKNLHFSFYSRPFTQTLGAGRMHHAVWEHNIEVSDAKNQQNCSMRAT